MKIHSPFLLSIVSRLLSTVIWLVTVSIRKTIQNPHHGLANGKHVKKAIYAMWHNRIFLLIGHFRHQDSCILVSQSHDGELIAQTAQHLGYTCVRGSSSRGGTKALRTLIHANHTSAVAFTVDGPRGPRYEVKEGIILLAAKTGLPIIPVTYTVSKKIVCNSWDRFMLPLPFSRASIIFHSPIHIDPNLTDHSMGTYKQAIKEALDDTHSGGKE